MVAGCDDGSVYTWDARPGANTSAVIAKVPENSSKLSAVSSVALSPDGRLLAAGTNDAGVHIWNIESREPQPLVSWSTRKGSVNSVVFTADGKRVLTGGSDKAVKIWDVSALDQAMQGEANVGTAQQNPVEKTGYEPNFMSAFRDHTDAVQTISISRDSQWVLSGSVAGTVWLWELEGTEEQCKFKLSSSWSAGAPDVSANVRSSSLSSDVNRLQPDSRQVCNVRQRRSENL